MSKIDLELRVPKSLEAITLKQYQEYMKIYEQVNKDLESEGGSLKDDQNEFLNLKTLEIFCGLTLKDSYGLPVSLFDSVIDKIGYCFSQETPLVNRFSLIDPNGDEVEFGFIPKLDDMSMGEFLDLNSYINDWDNMHKAMAVLYRPIIAGKKGLYRIQKYKGSDKYADAMKDAPINVVIGARVFFYRLGKKLSTHTMKSLVLQEMDSQDSRLKKTLEENGGGINHFMHSLEEMSKGLEKSQHFHYMSA